jgi:hypothetical protein
MITSPMWFTSLTQNPAQTAYVKLIGECLSLKSAPGSLMLMLLSAIVASYLDKLPQERSLNKLSR